MLLNKLQYLKLMNSKSAEKVTPTVAETTQALEYASKIWPSLQLKTRTLKPSDVSGVFQHHNRRFFHIKAFPRKMPNTFVIVIMNDDQTVHGHILIDLGAEYSQPILDCPARNFEKTPKPKDIQKLIPSLTPDVDDPFAVLTTGDGTYMQTFCSPEGFVLEYQLVNLSGHYEIPKPTTADQVVKAMLSYAFGKNEWLEMFDWRLQQLS